MTERDYAIRSFKEITLNASCHTEERMDVYYKKIKELTNDYQDLILENQMVLEELEQECQEKINENISLHFLWKRNSRDCLRRMNGFEQELDVAIKVVMVMKDMICKKDIDPSIHVCS